MNTFKLPSIYYSTSFILLFLAALACLFSTSYYFLSPTEPILNILIIICIALFAISYLTRKSYYLFFASWFCLCFIVSLAWVTYNIQNKNTYFIPAALENKQMWVLGQISKIYTKEKKTKIILTHTEIFSGEKKTPENLTIRISIPTSRLKKEKLETSNWIAAQVKLFSPQSKKHFTDFNFKRKAWIENISAVGYLFGELSKTTHLKNFESSAYIIEDIRRKLTEHILSHKNSQERAVMAALITGKKNHVSPETYAAYRDSGMAHLLAISGLHIGLIMGISFIFLRRIIGFHTYIIYSLNTKRLATIGAWFLALSYTLIAGATLPTMRAFIMVTFLLFALLSERLNQSLRAFCWAVIIILTLFPESILTASFQMSFIAVFTLLIWGEKRRFLEKNNTLKYKPFFISHDIWRYIQTIFTTSTIAALSTMPIAAWHFHNISLTGIFINLIAIPITAFWIMPFGLIGTIFSFISMEAPFMFIMEKGVFFLNNLAIWGKNLSTSGIIINQSESIAIIVGILCIFSTCLYTKRNSWRIFSIAIAFCLPFLAKELYQSKIYITPTGNSAIIMKKHSAEIVFMHPDETENIERIITSIYGQHSTVISNESDCDSEACTFSKKIPLNYLNQNHVGIPKELCFQKTPLIASKSLWQENCPALIKTKSNSLGIYIYKDGSTKEHMLNNQRIWERKS